MSNDLILQMSIPFCFHQCAHCAYPSCAYDPSVLRAYVRAMHREIEAAGPEMEEYVVRAISIEGGCPSLVTADALAQLLSRIRRCFHVAEDAQIILQTMPGEYSRALMEKMRDQHVNHWIIGLETAQLGEHEALERPYKFDAITMVDMALRTFHPRDLSFHLLCGLPGQTLHSFQSTLERVLIYQPEHLTVAPLTVRSGTRLAERIRLGELTLPGEETVQALQACAAQTLAGLGYRAYTLTDYALPGKENQFLLRQMAGCEQLGIGYHARSRYGGITYRNGHSLQEYLEHSDDITVIANDVHPVA